jgi:hypothetical protein
VSTGIGNVVAVAFLHDFLPIYSLASRLIRRSRYPPGVRPDAVGLRALMLELVSKWVKR